jgi:hypothetical protein
MFDLAKYNQTPVCHTALCAFERMFGRERAVLMTWAYLKYGVSLTPFVNIEGDRYGFSADTIRSIIVALHATPEALRTVGFKNFSFYRAQRDDTYRTVFGQRVIATNSGAVYSVVDEKSEVEQVGIFIHEIGHRVSGEHNEKDGSLEWKNASGWKAARGDQRYFGTDPWLSRYQQYSGAEDFAETYALYRLNPERLQRLSSARFAYMKTHVFGGVDYFTNICDGSP